MFKLHVIWRDRNYSYELDWKEAFERAGHYLTEDLREADADGYVILQGVLASYDMRMDELTWLKKKKVKKLAMVVNSHKLVNERKVFFADQGITAGTEADEQTIWKPYLPVPPGLNQYIYKEDVKRKDRPHLMGFRGHEYRKDNSQRAKRNRIIKEFNHFPEVQQGLKPFIFGRDKWCQFLNSIKSTVSTEAGFNGYRCILARHFEAIGTKTIQVMYPARFNGILDETNYIPLSHNHSNLKEVMEKLEDESFCEELTSRTREKMLESHTLDHRVKQIEDWFNA